MNCKSKLIYLLFILILLIGGIYLVWPTIERNSMIECTLKWGRLAPFPKTAKNFNITTEGSAFTRTFIGSFSDTPETIQKWLKDSSGVQEGVQELRLGRVYRYTLKTGEGESYGEVRVSADGTAVEFKISWS